MPEQPAAPGPADLAERWLAALLAWDEIRAQLPDTPAPYRQAVAKLRHDGQPLPADRVMAEAVRRFPGDLALATEHARGAEMRKDWEEALVRWKHAATTFPQHPLAFWRAGAVLRRELGRKPEAEAFLEVAMAKFPGYVDVWTEHAALAAERGDRPAALQRFQTIRERFPGQLGAWRACGALLREERRFAEADTLIAEALVRFPDNPDLLADRAWIAQDRQDWEEALLRWEALRAASPDSRPGYWRAGQILAARLARFDEADALFSVGLMKFPDHAEMAMDYALVAERRSDWPEAARRWQAAVERFPGNAAVLNAAEQLKNRAPAG